MGQQYTVHPVKISSLLEDIKNKKIVIPEIQRPFVWENKQVRDLMDSIYNGYPVGYIIIWEGNDIKLKDGSISQGKTIIIDGQQRITALTAAIVGQEIVDKNYQKKRIQIAFNPIEEKFETVSSSIKKDTKWISDISTIFQEKFSSRRFISNYCKKNNIPNEDGSILNNESNTQSDNEKLSINGDIIEERISKITGIKDCELGVIKISSSLDIDCVTDIFVRINSKGKSLSQADFAMSKIASNNDMGGDIIRKTIDYFCHILKIPSDYTTIEKNDHEFSKTKEFQSISWAKDNKDDIYLPDYSDCLRVAFTSQFHRGKMADLVSLLSGRNFEKRTFDEQIIQDSFSALKNAVNNFINYTNFQEYLMILKSIGIINKGLIRSQNVLNFGYILYISLKNNKIDKNIIEKSIRKWIILTILTGRYSGSPESAFHTDINQFINNNPLDYIKQVELGELSNAFWENVLVGKLETTSVSPFFNVFLMSQIKEHDKGFLSKNKEVRSIVENKGDIHHLFPKQYLIDNGLKDNLYNQIANYVYMETDTNIKIKKKAPYIYMREVLQQCDTQSATLGGIVDKDELLENLKSHCIPETFLTMKFEDYNDFLVERRKLMSKKIKKYYENL